MSKATTVKTPVLVRKGCKWFSFSARDEYGNPWVCPEALRDQFGISQRKHVRFRLAFSRQRKTASDMCVYLAKSSFDVVWSTNKDDKMPTEWGQIYYALSKFLLKKFPRLKTGRPQRFFVRYLPVKK